MTDGRTRWLAERFEANRTHLRAVAYRMLGSLSEAEDAVQESLAPAQPRRHRRGREPGRMADDGGRAGVPGHAALAQVAARGAAGRARARADREPRRGDRPRARGAAGRFGRSRRCWWCSKRWTPAERLAFVLHECSPCPSTRSRRSWGARRRRPGSSRAARAAACRDADRFPTPISPGSAKWSTPFSRPRAAVTSTRCSRCSTRMSCCEPTAAPWQQAPRAKSAAPAPWPGRR